MPTRKNGPLAFRVIGADQVLAFIVYIRLDILSRCQFPKVSV